MSDTQAVVEAPGRDRDDLSQEWDRLARDEARQATDAPDPEDRHETAAAEEGAPNGQAETSPTDAEAAGRPAPGETTDDIWATAPEPLRLAYEAERASRVKAEQEARTNGGRASAAQREAAALRARIVTPPARQASPKEPEAPQDEDLSEALRAAKEEYPELVGPLLDEIVAMRQKVARLEASDATAAEQRRARDELEFTEHLAREEQKLAEAHGDWQELVLTPDFVDWVRASPRMIQEGLARNGDAIVDSDEAGRIISLYKAERGIGQPQAQPGGLADKRQRQLEGARTVPARAPGATAAGIPDDFDAAFEALRRKEERERARKPT